MYLVRLLLIVVKNKTLDVPWLKLIFWCHMAQIVYFTSLCIADVAETPIHNVRVKFTSLYLIENK